MIYNPNIKIIPLDTQGVGFCNSGSRNWFKQRGLNWGLFVQGQYTINDLVLAHGGLDEVLKQVYNNAHERVKNGRK